VFDPSLMIAPNVGGMIQQGIEKGQQQRQQNMAKGALAALVRDPTNQRALEALAQVDPQAAMQFKQQQLEQTKAGLEQHRDNIIKGAQLIRQMNPKDDASWQQTLAVAHQAGIDVSQVPPHFDPQYIQGVIQLADTFAPKAGGDGFTLSPGQVRYGLDGKPMASVPGQPRYYPVPPGGKLVLDPSYGGGAPQGGAPAPGTIEEGYRFKGGDPADQNNWEPAGGQTAPPSGMFPMIQ
jgi:hypothetical protein